MSKKLVAFFSASGVTEQVAKKLAEVVQADIYAICPEIPYTEEDLDWHNNKSRSSIEMGNPSSRPSIAGKMENMSEYDTIYIGFPIWWYVAPTIVNTFLESYDLQGKVIIPFATSGSSGMGKTNEKLICSCKGATLLEGKRFPANVSREELRLWAEIQ